MINLFNMWKKSEEIPQKGISEVVSQMLFRTNEIFKTFLNKCSWFVYLIAGILILCCFYYYIYDYKRRIELRRRRHDMQRASERIPQRRRPGAVYRDHQIFRNVIKTVRPYMDSNETDGQQHHKSYALKRTRSGAIYGHYDDRENITD